MGLACLEDDLPGLVARCRQLTLIHFPALGHFGPRLVTCFCGSSLQSAGISNCSDGMLEVSIKVVSEVSDTTRTSAPGAGAAPVELPADDCGVTE
ncbi:MAG: hypothetical protein WBE91_23240, partial [Steroidobacteraceae bacterium]